MLYALGKGIVAGQNKYLCGAVFKGTAMWGIIGVRLGKTLEGMFNWRIVLEIYGALTIVY